MRIGLVSDTHGLFDPRLCSLLAGCDRILHAGDVVGRHVLDELRRLAPVDAVRGNNDRGGELPDHLVLELGPFRLLLIHELGKPEKPAPAAARTLAEGRPQIVVFGHSHQPAAREHGGVLYLNPGSAGPQRFRLPRAAGTLSIEGRTATALLVDLHERAPLAQATFSI